MQREIAADATPAHGGARTAAVALALLVSRPSGLPGGGQGAAPPAAGLDPPSFITQSSDARGTILIGTTQGVFRTVDAGASWSRTSPTGVPRAVSAGFTSGSTIVSRGRLFQRGDLSLDHVNRPTRAPFFGGVARSFACSPAASSTRWSRTPRTACS